jgi:deazaflavin-dependent oxidoreductase (nitroreductase family)
MGAFRVLLLETTGRASGRRRSVGLSHLEDGGPFCVVGSYSGEERDPAWALNLRAEPRAVVTTRRRTVPVAARELEGEERDRIFERFVALDPSYAGPVPHVADDPGVRAAAGAALTRCRR